MINATRVDGGVEEVLSDSNSIWVAHHVLRNKQPRGSGVHPVMLVDSQTIPYAAPVLVPFEPVEWSDASLGCLETHLMYIEVVTLGFHLAFEHECRRYEYHTNQDGGRVVACES